MRRRYRPTDLDIIQISFAGRPATRRPLLSLPGFPLPVALHFQPSLFRPVHCFPSLSSLCCSAHSSSESLRSRRAFIAARLLSQAGDGSSVLPPDDVGSAHFCQRDVWISVLFVIIFRSLDRSNLAILTMRGRRWGRAAPGIKMDEWPE